MARQKRARGGELHFGMGGIGCIRERDREMSSKLCTTAIAGDRFFVELRLASAAVALGAPKGHLELHHKAILLA